MAKCSKGTEGCPKKKGQAHTMCWKPVVPAADIRETAWRLAEPGYATWTSAVARLGQLKEAGYHGAAVDMGDHINIVVDGGKRGLPIEGVPERR